MTQRSSGEGRCPAFQFYADDFLSGTLDMSQAEVGAYIRLLCYQWNRGSIPVETEKQQRLAGGSVSVDVLAKFPAGEDGHLRNPRLEHIRQLQEAYRQKQAEKGRKSAESRRNSTTVEPRLNHGSSAVDVRLQPDGQPEGNSPTPSPSPNNKPPISPKGEEVPEGFAEFWAVYPKKVAKPMAMRAWRKISPTHELTAVIILSVKALAQTKNWTKDGGAYIPHPATFLNNCRWEDRVETVAAPVDLLALEAAHSKAKFAMECHVGHHTFVRPEGGLPQRYLDEYAALKAKAEEAKTQLDAARQTGLAASRRAF